MSFVHDFLRKALPEIPQPWWRIVCCLRRNEGLTAHEHMHVEVARLSSKRIRAAAYTSQTTKTDKQKVTFTKTRSALIWLLTRYCKTSVQAAQKSDCYIVSRPGLWIKFSIYWSWCKVTPEMLVSSEFNKLLLKMYNSGQMNRLVVDEAHCISVRLVRSLLWSSSS